MKRLLAIFCILFQFMALPAMAQGRFAPIIDIEYQFAQKTKETSYPEGFLEFADIGAVWFNPGPKNAFNELSAMVKDETKKVSTPLRWYPNFMGMSHSGDFAFDFGIWYKENGQEAGNFFTIWQKAADGKWRFTLDTGAGIIKDKAQLPKDRDYKYLPKSKKSPKGNLFDFDENFNDDLNKIGAQKAYKSYINEDTILATEGFAPTNFGGDGAKLLSNRPDGDWEFAGTQFSKSRDLIVTYGHVKKEDLILGRYIRLWQWNDGNYKLIIDIFRPENEKVE